MSVRDDWLCRYYIAHAKLWRGHMVAEVWMARAIDRMLNTKAHYDLMGQFEREFPHRRLDKEDKALWLKGNIYQNGDTNELFLAYRRGYAYGMAVS